MENNKKILYSATLSIETLAVKDSISVKLNKDMIKLRNKLKPQKIPEKSETCRKLIPFEGERDKILGKGCHILHDRDHVWFMCVCCKLISMDRSTFLEERHTCTENQPVGAICPANCAGIFSDPGTLQHHLEIDHNMMAKDAICLASESFDGCDIYMVFTYKHKILGDRNHNDRHFDERIITESVDLSNVDELSEIIRQDLNIQNINIDPKYQLLPELKNLNLPRTDPPAENATSNVPLITVRNVDLLRDPTVSSLNSNGLSGETMTQINNSTYRNQTDEYYQSPVELSSYNNEQSVTNIPKITIKNIEILKNPTPEIKKSFLHLRTVDELNLLNPSELLGVSTNPEPNENQPQVMYDQQNLQYSDNYSYPYEIPTYPYYQDNTTDLIVDTQQFLESTINQNEDGMAYSLPLNDNKSLPINTLSLNDSVIDCFNIDSGSDFGSNEEIINDFLSDLPPELDDDIWFVDSTVNNNDNAQFYQLLDTGKLKPTTLTTNEQKSNNQIIVAGTDLPYNTEHQEIQKIIDINNEIELEPTENAIQSETIESNGNGNKKTIKATSGRPKGSNEINITKLRKQTKNFKENEHFHKCTRDNCNFRSEKSFVVEYHERTHNIDDDSFNCPNCDKIDFSNVLSLHSHLWREHKIDMDLFSCPYCDYKTPSRSVLKNNHLKIHSDAKDFVCDQCGHSVKTRRQLKEHYRRHRDKVKNSLENKQIVTCDICSMVFGNVISLRNHKNLIHVKQTEFRCKVCDKLFSSKAAKQSHENKHITDSDSYLFICCDCPYKTNDRNSFNKHIKKHTGKGLYECSVCQKYKTIQTSSLKTHIETKHPERADEFVFRCPHCKFTGINKKNFDVHVRNHNTVELQSTTEIV